MKKLIKSILPLGILLALCLTTIAQESTSQATPKMGTDDYLLVTNGFKIFKLGSPISNYNNLDLLTDKGDEKTYVVTDTSLLSIGGHIKLETIQIDAYKGLLLSIKILVDKDNKGALLQTLKTAYGHITYQPNKYIQTHHWISSSKTNPSTKSLVYIGGSTSDKGVVIFTDDATDIMKSKDEREKAKISANDI